MSRSRIRAEIEAASGSLLEPHGPSYLDGLDAREEGSTSCGLLSSGLAGPIRLAACDGHVPRADDGFDDGRRAPRAAHLYTVLSAEAAMPTALLRRDAYLAATGQILEASRDGGSLRGPLPYHSRSMPSSPRPHLPHPPLPPATAAASSRPAPPDEPPGAFTVSSYAGGWLPQSSPTTATRKLMTTSLRHTPTNMPTHRHPLAGATRERLLTVRPERTVSQRGRGSRYTLGRDGWLAALSLSPRSADLYADSVVPLTNRPASPTLLPFGVHEAATLPKAHWTSLVPMRLHSLASQRAQRLKLAAMDHRHALSATCWTSGHEAFGAAHVLPFAYS